MRGSFRFAQSRGQSIRSRRNFTNDNVFDFDRSTFHLFGPDQTESSLPATIHLDIDFGEKFGVEKRAVLGPVRIIDPISTAKRVKRSSGPSGVFGGRVRECR